MRKSDYLWRRDALVQRNRRVATATLAAMLAVLIVAIPLAALLPAPGHRQAVALLLLLIGIAAAVFHGWQRRHGRRGGLACGYCGTTLLGTAGDAAVATDRCGRCGERVFDES